ncbi:3-deoxy-D-manno-octulosonate cytidylyltransferase [Penicillium concentricum]|uniref:3-deoxy-manno-octulosonate cytidylyltransferase n=1 Tax=Penicillium concentricum TaxID=293559 RepID=A0A9W9V9H2_9EURO|nr:3-deoxy-D-manno-octulosonate cytidylyltransferase [Penicillium concentricum]KAJ5372534.1 3-deoxy-D-manno-octulosonate cytidylyltransferase [Penicillium concentricum]
MSFIVIIPSRFASTRLPGKPLAIIHGKPMIAHVVTRSQHSGASRVIVATDHPEIAKAAEAAGAEAILTREDHQSGTERLAETADLLHIDDNEIIINVQGDEPFIEPELIAQVARDLSTHTTNMVTLATPIRNASDALDPNIVKVVLDADGNALYFSRALIPWDRDAGGLGSSENILQHIGLYGYRAGFLRKYPTFKRTSLEDIEKLEQLRVLYHGEKIHVSVTKSVLGLGVDTEQDLERARCMSSE